MAVPSAPTIAEIVTEGLKRGGRVSPSSAEITSATTHQFREIKADIHLTGGRSNVLLAQYVTPTIVGQSRYAFPTDADDIRTIQLIETSNSTIDTADYFYANAAGGGASTITLHASFSQDEAAVAGRFIYLVAGTGVNQMRQIVDYDDSTKVATVDAAWTTQPVSGTDYLIETNRTKIYDYDKPWQWDTIQAPFQQGRPFHAAKMNREVWLDYAPDRVYVLQWDYWVDLDMLDEAGTQFLKHVRTYRSLWLQGVAVKTMQRYDEDRYGQEKQNYDDMLLIYGGRQGDIRQIEYQDV